MSVPSRQRLCLWLGQDLSLSLSLSPLGVAPRWTGDSTPNMRDFRTSGWEVTWATRTQPNT